MIRAYEDCFLDEAKERLGEAFEYAICVCGIDGQEFLDLFVASDYSTRFGRGDAALILGMSGTEFARRVLVDCGLSYAEDSDYEYDGYPEAYWCGWILAQYQWSRCLAFSVITYKVSYEDLESLYIYHEAPIEKAVGAFDEYMKDYEETNLAKLRKEKGLSQKELAKVSEVSVRSIQLYEQRQNNINNAQYNNLVAIAEKLDCGVAELLEYEA